MASFANMKRLDRRGGRQRWSMRRLAQGLRAVWQRIVASLATYFPPDEPQPSPPLAKAAALREGALLSENVDAMSNKHVA
jgi:hypothetical protein